MGFYQKIIINMLVLPESNMQKAKNTKNRIWELDFLRGIALILMIYFHIIYDLNELYNVNVSYSSGINYFIGKFSAILFMLLSGISSWFSKSNVKRGLKVAGIAIILTIITHLYDPAFGIKFGILHLLGTCMLLSPLLIKLNKNLLILLGSSVILLDRLISGINPLTNIFFPFGVYNSSFSSSDYYPLIPWMGIFIYGLALGKMLYANKQSLLPFTPKDNIINIAGRHTLTVYLAHQPVIMAVLYLINL